jgi:uracil-DNA glycosylase family protein
MISGPIHLLAAAMPKATISAADFLPRSRDIDSLRKAAQKCRGCPLYANATQAVFGEGPTKAHIVMIGEQPGDVEDCQGHPFVGPAGKLLDKTLEAVGIPRQEVYVTNAVKHFKWTPRGKKRMHAKPSSREVSACRPWLEAELAEIEPPIVVLLGATAAQSLLGNSFRLTKQRGKPFETSFARWTFATYHPSAVLRTMQLAGGDELRREFESDLTLVARKLREIE